MSLLFKEKRVVGPLKPSHTGVGYHSSPSSNLLNNKKEEFHVYTNSYGGGNEYQVQPEPKAFSVALDVSLPPENSLLSKDGVIEPKVWTSFESRAGCTPYSIEIERKKRLYQSVDVGQLLKKTLNELYATTIYMKSMSIGRSNILQLDLYQFDDTDFEVYEPHIWIQLGTRSTGVVEIPVTACFRRTLEDEGVWKPAVVTFYNSNSKQFTVIFSQDHQQRELFRLDICFQAEDPFLFVERVKKAHESRIQAESLIRYNFYVDCMPTEDLPQIGKEQLNRIIYMATRGSKTQRIPDSSIDIQEVQMDYLRTMNKVTFDKFRAKGNNALMEYLCPLEKKNNFLKQPIPSLSSYTQQSQEFSFHTYLTNSEALNAILRVNEDCCRTIHLHLFNVKTNHSLKLEEFLQLQYSVQKTTHRTLHNEWPNRVANLIKSSLSNIGKGWYNLQENNRDTYEFSKLKLLLHRVNFMMQDTLRFLTEKSLHEYMEFISSIAEGIVHVQSAKQVTITYPQSIDKEDKNNKISENKTHIVPRVYPSTALFSLSICITVDKVIVNQTQVEEMNRKIEEWIPDEENEICPYTRIVPMEGQIFAYSTSLSSFAEAVLTVFDKALEGIKDIKQIEQLVMDKLFWSTHPKMSSVGLTESWVQEVRNQLGDVMKAAECPLKDYLLCFSEYIPFLNLNEETYIMGLMNNLPSLEEAVENHLNEANALRERLPSNPVELGVYAVSCTEIRSILIDKHRRIAFDLLKNQVKNCLHVATVLLEKFDLITRQLVKIPVDIEQMTEMKEYIESIPLKMEPLLKESEQLMNCRKLLDQFQYQMDKEDYIQIMKVRMCPYTIQDQRNVALMQLERLNSQFSMEMREKQAEFVETLRLIHAEVDGFKQYIDIQRVDQVYKNALHIESRLKKAEEDAALFNSREVLFGYDLTDYEALGKIKRDFEPYSMLWRTTSIWLKDSKKWMNGLFNEVNGEELENFVETHWNSISKANRFFEKSGIKGCLDISIKIKNEIASFRPHIPLVLALRNPGMQQRHWQILNRETKINFIPDSKLKLEQVLSMGLDVHLECITKVCETAGKEYQIETTLNTMEEQWKDMKLQIVSYRETETYILKGVDEIQALLDEQITLAQAMQFSAFKKPFEDRIDRWVKTLSVVSEVLDEWIHVQRSWLYLQPIFESPDINKQLPTEGKRFSTVDKNWRQTLSSAKNKPHVITFCNNEKLLQRFQESLKFLDAVQKGLSDFLETKRAAFARFYFLSNDELLSILSESKDVQLVQPHLKKCFEGIVSVEFRDDLSISAMISAEGEKVPFSNAIHPLQKNLEHWMKEVEEMMQTSIKNVMYASMQDYTMLSRMKWTQKWPGMCVLNASQYHWTKEMEEKMNQKGFQGVQEMLQLQLQQLADMVQLVRGPLEKMARITVGALTVIDVHARDVTERLVDQHVESKDDFLWCSQLRYYWDNDLFVEMVTARRPYGYEYLGNSFRLVITPLTDKCYMTLMAALQMVLGGAPAGPAGTGKTETTKDLAKALAKQCVVFNCSDGLDYIAMGKFFKGLACCGAWACFDEFNRINIEVLSVIGQQITTLQLAIRANEKRIVFEESDIAVNPQFGVFITMNPGYAGRSDLPDSLAALFRPVAMMVPDYAMIGEIMFFAYGYSKAKECGAKMVTTFKLCSEQLSSQCHYDYGMRAVKTVITAAGNLKRSEPNMDEEVLLLRALQDVNLPKFLADDIPLFNGIINDLFPGKSRPPSNLGVLVGVIQSITQQQQLQPHPRFISKVIQLYETICVRHGLMVVGPTGGGKSSNINVLAASLTELNFKHEIGFGFEKTLRYQLNPKAITMGQLYGAFDPNTHEWQDGILSTIYREAAACVKSDRKWVLFDGPVDAIWIENMNTVLDDNKKLCLNSGEIIQMSEQMTMMFEVEELSVASPATVSRTGMIYMEPTSLGLEPLLQSWLQSLPFSVQPQSLIKNRLQHLFELYWLPSLNFMRNNMKEWIPSVDNNLAQSLMRLLSCFFLKYEIKEGMSPTMESLEKIERNVESLFIFCLIWSVGVTTDHVGRQKFDSFLRFETTSHGCTKRIPMEGLVYDYAYIVEKESWVHWMETLEQPCTQMDLSLSFAEMIIPTTDSLRNTFWLEHCLPFSKHVMMVGPTGTGKTININQFLSKLDNNQFLPISLTFSAQTSANQVQDFLDSKMEKKRKGVYGPPSGKKMIVFVDDLNMPKQEKYFAQPPLELLRQWMDQGGWYDRKTLTFRTIVDIIFITSMGPPGGGRNPISSRFVRHFNIFGTIEMEDESKQLIFETILSSFVKTFHETIRSSNIVHSMVNATRTLYNTITKELLPTPAKCHYTFNLRDLAKVFQGILMCDPRKMINTLDFIRVWVHECQRVFKDRLTTLMDHEWFNELLKTQLSLHFFQHFPSEIKMDILPEALNILPEALDILPEASNILPEALDILPEALDILPEALDILPEALDKDDTKNQENIDDALDKGDKHQKSIEDALDKGDKRQKDGIMSLQQEKKEKMWKTVLPLDRVIYGDFMTPGADPKVYEEITDMEKLVHVIEEYLGDYNAQTKTPMQLVMFVNAIEHVARISRIIRQSLGNALLLGVGGSGRQSLTRLATYMADFQCYQVEISKGYGVHEWKEDLKKCLMIAGIDDQQVVFLFSDVQITNESMLEDLNNILNSGDVPNIYNSDELDQIMTQCRNECMKRKLPTTKMNIYAQYIARVRKNIHLVLCMSPLGNEFRDRLRMFPSLVNCCTIDWFSEWPAEALYSVAMSILTEQNSNIEGNNLENIVGTFQTIHQSVEVQSRVYYEKLRRYNYVTPTSYLELLSTFKSVLHLKKEEVETMRCRLQNGVDKIIQTKQLVAGMQDQLVALKPQLEKTQEEVEIMMLTITKDKKDADETKLIVEKEEEQANAMAKETKAIADDAQRDLDEALPALESAVQCLNKLKKADIDEVKALKNPPHGVKLTMEVSCIIFGIKPVYKNDPEKPAQKIKDYWESAQKTLLMNAKKFLEDMFNFDKDNIPSKIIQAIDPYMSNPDFNPSAVRKASVACEAICMWVRAMNTYYRVTLIVAPKKQVLAEAQAKLDITLEELAHAKSKLQNVIDRVAQLETNYNQEVEKKETLVQQVKQCETRLDSALKLINLLGGEEYRWMETVSQLNEDYHHLLGDVIISAGTISYLGAFTSEFRDECVTLWHDELTKRQVPFTKNCSILTTLADPVQVRKWHIAGLPSDNLSIQNGIIMARARCWPLLIDPQGQANRFIKTLGKETSENGIDVIKLSDKGFLKSLENGVRFGKWILLENITEKIDASLESILLQQKFKQGGQKMIKIGDSIIPYHDSFRFLMTTKLPNPHYPPETCVKVSLLNFTITPTGLEEQALGVTVQQEMPELAEKKNSLVVSNARMKSQLLDIENRILHMLANSKGNHILDDSELIETLSQAKVTSEDINEKMIEAEVTEKEIDTIREKYRPVAFRASCLFFCIADLSLIDPMYQYSLPWFIELFIKGIRNSNPSNDLNERLNLLNEYCTYSLYKNICRSLFEEHKLLFSFLLTIKILQGQNEIDPHEWRFLISGTTSIKAMDIPKRINPDPVWIDRRIWNELLMLSTLPQFNQFFDHFQETLPTWKGIFDSVDPQNEALPLPYELTCTSFQKLCILRCIRPDKMMEGIQNFVIEKLGKKFIEPPPFDLEGSYDVSTVNTPLIFVLSRGSDPAKDLLKFSESMKMSKKCSSISLGQGQGHLAARLIQEGSIQGKWVLLQNCHLAISWMPQLEKICEEMNPDTVHRDFRLWLTSRPCREFPTSILQNGVKMTKEPPKGIRANLRHTYKKLTNTMLQATSKPNEYKKLLFGLSFFHATIIERKRFGPLGWNIPYEFNDTDYDISRAQLEMFLDFYDEIPFQVLSVMTSIVNYGGRITDDKDMRTISSILKGFFNPHLLQDDYSFSKSGIYYSIPLNEENSLASYLEYIDSLPIHPEPEVFGMHENANISCAISETFKNFDIILNLQPRLSTGHGISREEQIAEIAFGIQQQLPSIFDLEQISMTFPTKYEESMNTVLVQEVQRYNALIETMNSSLPQLQNALKGLVVMSSELEDMANSLFNQKVPIPWERKAYPSLKPLSSWVLELFQRIKFIDKWVHKGTPTVYWLSGFFFPQGFLTGTLQNQARRKEIPIDTLSFEYILMKETEDELHQGPTQGGCYVSGLYIEGARWNINESSLVDPLPKELFSTLPILHLLPIKNREPPQQGIYRCPVYKIPTRTGTLSTTGHSTNFVFWIEIPSNKPTVFRNSLVSETNAQIQFADQDYWIKAGVACFLSLQY